MAIKKIFDEIKNESSTKKKVEIHCKSDSIPKLFIEWLNELLSLADVNSMLFSEFRIEKIKTEEAGFVIDGQALGEAIAPERHGLKTEVKAATYSGLKYEVRGKRHMLQCVIDI